MGISTLLLLIATNAIGGSAFFATSYTLKDFSSLGIVFWRIFLASLLFLPFSIRALRRAHLTVEDWLRMAGVGILGYALPMFIGAIGQNLSTATHASLLISVEPICVVFLSALFLNEKVTFLKITALFLSIAGSAMVVLQGIPFLNVQVTSYFRGDLLLCLQAVLFSLYSVIGKPVLRKVDAMSFTALSTTLGLLPLLCLAHFFVTVAPKAGAPKSAFEAMVYLATVVTFMGTMTWNMALEKTSASQVANFLFLQPLVGVLLGVLVLKEPLTLWSVSGGFLIIVGVYCAAKEPIENEAVLSAEPS